MIAYALLGVGAAFVVAGCALIYLPLALLATGAALIAVAYYGVEAK